MGPRKGLNRANSMLCAECVLPSGGLEIGCLPVGGAHVSGPQCPLGAGSLESISLVVSAVLGESAREGVLEAPPRVFPFADSVVHPVTAACNLAGVTCPEPLGSS